MAKIEKRGNLQWRARVHRKGYPDYSNTFEEKAPAVAWARALETAMGLADLPEVRRLTSRAEQLGGTVAALAAEYQRLMLPSVAAAPTLTPKEKLRVSNERRRIARIKARFGSLLLAMLTTADVNRWRDDRIKEGAAGGTVRHDLNMLSKLLQFAMNDLGLEGARNVVRDVKKPKAGKGRSRRTSDLELHYLQRAAREVPEGRPDEAPARGLAPLFSLAVATGARLGEFIALHWRDVDLKNGEMLLRDTKNGESRTVPLSDFAIAEFTALRAVQRIDDKVFDWARSDSAAKPVRRAIDRARAMYLADTLARGEKPVHGFLEDFRLHDLRHEAASRFLEQGFTIVEVAYIMGHKSPQMTLLYSHSASVQSLRIKMNQRAEGGLAPASSRQ